MIVEDPGHAVTFDLVAAMGFTAVPVPVDDLGIRPDALDAALARGASAVIMTPRAQAATGAAWDAGRAAELGEVLRRHPGAGVIEDDHAGPVAGVPAFSACARTAEGPGSPARWVTVRSVSKSLGPDLRLAVLAGDEATMTRVAGRQALGTGWVSYQLQELVADLWSDAAVARALDGRGADLRRPRRGPARRRWRGRRSRPPAGRASPAGSVPPTRTAWRPRWPRRAGRSPRASGSASPHRPVSGSPSPAWREADAPSFAADLARALRHRASRLD